MRKAPALLIPLATTLLVGSCSNPEEPFTPSLGTSAVCSAKWTYVGTKTLTVTRHTTNNFAGWFLTNTGTSSFTLNSGTPSKSGAVKAVRNDFPYPYTITPGDRTDIAVRFDVGAPGTGSVGLTVSASCGSLVAPIHPVVVE